MNKLLRYSFIALLAMIGLNVSADTTDELTASSFNITAGSSYADFSATGTSGASYAAQAMSTTDYIQIRSKNDNSGVVVTTSAGTIKSITISYNAEKTGTNAGEIDVYAKNTAYSAPSDLYNDNAGEKIGQITATNTSCNFTGSYKFFGIRSINGARYIDKITVVWEASGQVQTKTATTIEFSGDYLTKFTPGKDGDKVNLPTATVKASGAAVEGATVTWSLTKGSNWSADSDPAINGTKVEFGDHSRGDLTLKASYAGNDTYEASTQSYTLKVYKGYMAIKSILEDFPEVGGDTWKAKEAEWKAGTPISYWQVDAKSETEFTSKEALVTFVSGSYTYIKDNDGSLLLYGNNLGFQKGDKISGDFGNDKGFGAIYGTLKAYNGLLELAVNKADIEFVVKSSDNAVEAKTITIDQLTQANMNEYVKIENAEFISADNKNLKFKVGDIDLAVYNQFNVDVATLEANTKYTLTGMGCIYYKNEVVTPQLYLVEFEKATGGETTVDTWTVAGTPPLTYNTWDPSDTNCDMTPNGNGEGVSSYERDNIVLEKGTSYEFKVVKNHAWGEEYPEQNYVIKVDETALYHVKIFFNTTTHEITYEKAKMGEAGPVEHTWSVIGDLVGNWDTDTDMTKGEDGLYIAKFENVAAGTYKFKVRADHNWNECYGGGDDKDGNSVINVESDGSTVIITFDAENKVVKAAVEAGAASINTVKVAAQNGVIYNLAGQKVGADYKGLVIKNGRKYIQK